MSSKYHNCYELPLPAANDEANILFDDLTPSLSLRKSLSIEYVTWFCHLRWIFICAMLLLGIVTSIDVITEQFSLDKNLKWPFGVAVFLSFCNIFYQQILIKAQRLVKWNLLIQIIVDLVVLTIAVHFIGSVETHISLTYLFHIVLACIFFKPFQAMTLVLLSMGLFSSLLLLESYGVFPPSSIFVGTFRNDLTNNPNLFAFNLLTVFVIWFIIWFLTTQITRTIRKRDRMLNEVNQSLITLQEEKNKHMLRTTHELKAPFAAIQANAQLLMQEILCPLNDDAKDIVNRIIKRCKKLTTTILEMLQLANLRSETAQKVEFKEIDLKKIINYCIKLIEPVAVERKITLNIEVESCLTIGVVDHLKMLLGNIISNSILYSHKEGSVNITCNYLPNKDCLITVEDSGIGIHADKLDRVFDEHYRTEEALQHNALSSGLGLSIVRHIALTHHVGLKVESEVGVGTKFSLVFPNVEEHQLKNIKS